MENYVLLSDIITAVMPDKPGCVAILADESDHIGELMASGTVATCISLHPETSPRYQLLLIKTLFPSESILLADLSQRPVTSEDLETVEQSLHDWTATDGVTAIVPVVDVAKALHAYNYLPRRYIQKAIYEIT